MIPSKEQIAVRLLALALTGIAAGYGVSELDKLVESKHVQEITKQAVEILKQPEKAFQSQSQTQSQPITVDRLISEPIRYELPKPVMLTDLCRYYPDMQKCLFMKNKEIVQKGEENEKAEN